MKRLGFVFSVLLLSACTTGPKYEEYTSTDAACIKGNNANVLKFFSSGEAHVNILEIDGLQVNKRGFICVSPGKHSFGIVASNNNKTVNDYVDLNLQTARKYQLKATLTGISFRFKLYDVTVNNDSVVEEFKLKVNGNTTSTSVPIFIPSN